MQLHEEIIGKQIGKLVLEALSGAQIDYAEIVKIEALQALQKIKAIVYDDSLSDFDCVEQIVRALEDIGSSGGTRHDF